MTNVCLFSFQVSVSVIQPRSGCKTGLVRLAIDLLIVSNDVKIFILNY